MSYCTSCGVELLAGEVVLVDPDGAIYCSASCVGDVWGEEVVLGDEEAMVARKPLFAFEEAERLALAYLRLTDELEAVLRVLDGAAAALRRDRNPVAAGYEESARRVRDALRAAALLCMEKPAGRAAGHPAGLGEADTTRSSA